MNTDRFLNLTPHAIHLCDIAGQIIATFPPSGKVARCIQSPQSDMQDLEGFPVVTPPSYGAVDLGYTAEELIALGNPHIIVSSLCLDGAADTYSGRVVAPDAGTSSVVRNDKGRSSVCVASLLLSRPRHGTLRPLPLPLMRRSSWTSPLARW